MKILKNSWIILVSILVLCLGAGFVVGYFTVANQAKKEFEDIEPKRYALELALENKELQQLIGAPIVLDTLNYKPKREGQLQLKIGAEGFDFSANSVELEIPLKGPSGNARLVVVADKKENSWVYDTLEVRLENSARKIDLK